MARIIQDKYIFIHAAKTGGTFFKEALNRFGVPNYELGKKHDTLKDCGWTNTMDLVPIMFIRHPVSWYRSRWRFARMTYFDHKIKYMPEAQGHWMAKVWSDHYPTFVMNTLKTYPKGVASEYFAKMLDGAPANMHLWKYEELTNKTFDALRYLFGYRDIKLDEISSLPKNLNSAEIILEALPDWLEEQIVDVEHNLIAYYR